MRSSSSSCKMASAETGRATGSALSTCRWYSVSLDEHDSDGDGDQPKAVARTNRLTQEQRPEEDAEDRRQKIERRDPARGAVRQQPKPQQRGANAQHDDQKREQRFELPRELDLWHSIEHRGDRDQHQTSREQLNRVDRHQVGRTTGALEEDGYSDVGLPPHQG